MSPSTLGRAARLRISSRILFRPIPNSHCCGEPFSSSYLSRPRTASKIVRWTSSSASAGFGHDQQPRQVVNTDLMLEFFERLDSLPEDKRRVFRFVLALYLMRRKEFTLLRVARGDGGERLIFRRRRTGEEMDVESPGLSEEQIEQTEEQLSRLLNVCL